MGIKEEVLELEKEVKDIQEHSFAMELLKDQKKQNKRQFIVILVILGMWFATIGYLIYILNDIGVETTTTETYDMNTDNGNNNFIGGHKLTEQQVKEIYLSSLSQKKLSKLYKVSATNIAYIKKKKLWRWLTDTLD